MIKTFGNTLAEDLFYDRNSRVSRAFPQELRRIARRKLLYLHDATDLRDLRVPPGNRLEALKGDLRGFHAIRINDQWRLIFRWIGGQAGMSASSITTGRLIRRGQAAKKPLSPWRGPAGGIP